MSAKERYLEAVALAKAGDYPAALKLLKTIDHPKARALESRIEARMSQPRTWNARRVIALTLFVAFFVGMVYVAYGAYQQQREYALYSAVVSICWDVYIDTMGAERFDYCRDAVPRALNLWHEEIRGCYDQYGSDANPTPFVRCMADNNVTL